MWGICKLCDRIEPNTNKIELNCVTGSTSAIWTFFVCDFFLENTVVCVIAHNARIQEIPAVSMFRFDDLIVRGLLAIARA